MVGFGEASDSDCDWFSINFSRVGDNINVVVLHDELPSIFYSDLSRFAAHYSKSGIVELEVAGENRSILYQAAPVIDLEQAHAELLKLEQGWRLEDNSRLLIPPLGSTLKYDKYREILKAASYEALAVASQELLKAA